jgi:mRNA interferase MazF
MQKDFDKWNNIKKEVDRKVVSRDLYFYEREVWWCSLGFNVGVEADGKNNNFERPALIIKKFNGDMVWVAPLTSKERLGGYYHKITHEEGDSWVCLSQIKTLSTKRLLRKIGMVSHQEFEDIVGKIISYIKIGPHIAVRSSEAEATNGVSID